METIDKIIYINLDYRKDRKEEILNEFKKLGIPDSKIERFPAISFPACPNIGCVMSHAKAALGYETVMILEDGFNFKDCFLEKYKAFLEFKKK